MNAMEEREVPVLVVGAGPAGLTAAAALAHHGIGSLVVERRREPLGHPRATVISTRTMEILRGWGLEHRVLAGGVDVEWLLWLSETLAGAAGGQGVEVGLPTRAQAALISPTAPACVPQDHLERVLEEHVRSPGPARVERGAELVALEQRPDGVVARIRILAGAEIRVRAAHVIGADGARSAVRRALGIAMQGPDDIFPGVSSVVRAPLWRLVGEHRYGIYSVTHPRGESTFLPAGPDDRWVFAYTPEPDGPRQVPTAAQMAARLREAAGAPGLPVTVEWVGTFVSGAQIADRFRDGRAFLVGDAAHRVTPRGGTGMNTAVHDAFDLGWRLAWVLRGWAGDGLLDGYERERRPVAAHNVARSADPAGSRRAAGEELRIDLGARIAHHWLGAPGPGASTLDLPAQGFTLLTGPRDEGWRAPATGVPAVPPVALRRLDELTARSLGLRACGGMLVRPDAVMHAWWPAAPPDATGLRRALRIGGDAGARRTQPAALRA